MNREHDMATDTKYSWLQNYKKISELKPYSYKVSGLEENKILSRIRKLELIHPASFSNRTLIDFTFNTESIFEKPFNFNEYKQCTFESLDSVNIPINKIVGLDSTNNLDNYEYGMTFQNVIFQCLHGTGINEKSVSFLTGNESKNNTMPHDPLRGMRKSRAVGGIKATQYGEWFVIDSGRQRTLIAMYLIWQKYGESGFLKNVSVTRCGIST